MIHPILYTIQIYEDNQGAIALANDTLTHRRTRHIDIRFHPIRQHVNDKLVKVIFVGTDEMIIADGMTKLLQKALFKRFTDKTVTHIK